MKVSIDGTVYPFEDKLMIKEAMAVQQVTGLTPIGWQKAVEAFDPVAIAALVWLARRRNGEPELAFDDVDFDIARFDVDVDDPPTDPAISGSAETGT